MRPSPSESTVWLAGPSFRHASDTPPAEEGCVLQHYPPGAAQSPVFSQSVLSNIYEWHQCYLSKVYSESSVQLGLCDIIRWTLSVNSKCLLEHWPEILYSHKLGGLCPHFNWPEEAISTEILAEGIYGLFPSAELAWYKKDILQQWNKKCRVIDEIIKIKQILFLTLSHM